LIYQRCLTAKQRIQLIRIIDRHSDNLQVIADVLTQELVMKPTEYVKQQHERLSGKKEKGLKGGNEVKTRE